MASQITEIIIFNMQPIVINEANSLLAHGKWNDTLSTLTQQDGVRTVYWGQTIESQGKVYLLLGMLFSHQYDETNHDSNECLTKIGSQPNTV